MKGIIDYCLEEDIIKKSLADGIYELIEKDVLVDAGREIDEIFKPENTHDYLKSCLVRLLLRDQVELSGLHNVVAKIPFTSYYSNYYDTFIEDAYAKIRGSELKRFDEGTISNAYKAIEKGNQIIIKIHGDFTNPRRIYFGDRSCDRFENGGAACSEYKNYLSFLLTSSSILFIGCDGLDSEFNSFLNKVLILKGVTDHWLLSPEGDIPQLKAKKLYEDKRIHVIEYSTYNNCEELVRFLEALSKPHDLRKDPRRTETVSPKKLDLLEDRPSFHVPSGIEEKRSRLADVIVLTVSPDE